VPLSRLRHINLTHEQEARQPNRAESSGEKRQRLGTNNIPKRSMGFNKEEVIKGDF
jgi:hypothetical protein